MTKPKTYVGAKQVRARYGGISDMTLWRWYHDPKMGFPQPIKINRIKFWDEADLDAFDARVSGKVAA
jgi:predicted DNA-binding transcriptional regulator AlpA